MSVHIGFSVSVSSVFGRSPQRRLPALWAVVVQSLSWPPCAQKRGGAHLDGQDLQPHAKRRQSLGQSSQPVGTQPVTIVTPSHLTQHALSKQACLLNHALLQLSDDDDEASGSDNEPQSNNTSGATPRSAGNKRKARITGGWVWRCRDALPPLAVHPATPQCTMLREGATY